MLASPVIIINCRDEEADIKAIIDIIQQNQIGKIIIGLPRSMDGNIGKQAKTVKCFYRTLRNRTEVPIEFRDERLTTVSAKRLMRNIKKTDKTRHDAIAAAIILQSYLDEAL
jgi:putative Holliday junction resolvase